MLNTEECVSDVVDNLSRLIMVAGHQLQNERYHPRSSPDESDAEIEHKATRIQVLRKLRNAFEDEMCQPAEPQF